MTTLITGATGSIGRNIVRALVDDGIAVRAVSRTPDAARLPAAVEVVQGDLAHVPRSAFAGVDKLFLFPAETGVESFVEQAVSAGVSRIVVLSSLAVSGRNTRDSESPTAGHHRRVEEAVLARTDDWTVLRPGNFANNLLFWSFAIRTGQPVRMPYAESSQVLIHETDIAAAAVQALTLPGQAGSILELTGPTSLTKVQQLAAISSAIGREVPWVEISPDEFRSDMAQFMPADIVEMLLRYWAETVDAPEVPLPGLPGIPSTSLAQWAHDHRDAFLA